MEYLIVFGGFAVAALSYLTGYYRGAEWGLYKGFDVGWDSHNEEVKNAIKQSRERETSAKNN